MMKTLCKLVIIEPQTKSKALSLSEIEILKTCFENRTLYEHEGKYYQVIGFRNNHALQLLTEEKYTFKLIEVPING